MWSVVWIELIKKYIDYEIQDGVSLSRNYIDILPGPNCNYN